MSNKKIVYIFLRDLRDVLAVLAIRRAPEHQPNARHVLMPLQFSCGGEFVLSLPLGPIIRYALFKHLYNTLMKK